MSAARTLAACLLLCLGVSGARAQDAAGPDRGPTGAAGEAARHVAEGRRLYAELDLVASIESMRRALSVPGIPEALRLEAFEYIGSSYVVLDQASEARAAFAAMLSLDPYHVVREPSGSPKIARFVEEVRATVVDDAALDPSVRLRAQIPRAGRVGRGTPVRFEVVGGDRVASVEVYVRGGGEQGYGRIGAEPEAPGRFVAEVPGRPAPDELDLYAQARDGQGRVVARAGEPLSPLSLSIRPGEAAGAGAGPSLFEQWWFWAAVGVAVLGGTVLAIGLSGGDQAPAGTLPPGRFELP